MPIGGFNLVEGSAASEHRDTSPTPAWAPEWLPSKPTLDYIITLATFSFLVLGSLYFMGVRVRPVRAVVEARDALPI